MPSRSRLRPPGAPCLTRRRRCVSSLRPAPARCKEVIADHELPALRVQVYLEKAKQARAEFEKARDEWHTKADPRLLRAVNIQRRAKNMPTVHAYGVRRPLSPYIKCVSCFPACRRCDKPGLLCTRQVLHSGAERHRHGPLER